MSLNSSPEEPILSTTAQQEMSFGALKPACGLYGSHLKTLLEWKIGQQWTVDTAQVQ